MAMLSSTASRRRRGNLPFCFQDLPGKEWMVETERKALRNNECAVKVTQTAEIRRAGQV
jgi:hypothetical protein